MYLLDTNVISEVRRPKPHGAVLAWLRAHEKSQLYLCAVTAGEIQVGIERTRTQDIAKAQAIEVWLEHMTGTFEVLPMDTLAFREWARLMHRRSNTLFADAMIAAVAKTRGLTVATRNTADFKGFGVAVVNPFKT
jgi:toxin FitB